MTEDEFRENIETKRQMGQDVLRYLEARAGRRLTGRKAKWAGVKNELDKTDFFLFCIHEITFEEKAPRKEAMENILGTFRGMDGISFVYIILGDENGVKFYFGVARDKSFPDNKLPFSIHDLETDILIPSMFGNFRGSKIEEVQPKEKKAILDRLCEADLKAGMLEGVPGVDDDNENFQGTDRLIDVMMGDDFGFVVIATPYTDAEVDTVERHLYELSDAIAPLARYTLQSSHGWTSNHNENETFSEITQAGNSTQHTVSESRTDTNTTNDDERQDDSNQIQSSANETANEQWTASKNYNLNDSNTNGGSSSRHEKSYSAGNGSNEGHSVQNQSNYSYTMSATKEHTTSNSLAKSQGYTDGTTTSDSMNYSKNTSLANGDTENHSTSLNEQMETESKSAADWLEYVDKVLLPRLDHGRGKGIFLCCTYLFAKKRTILYRLANTAISLYSGPKGNKSALFFSDLTDSEEDQGCLHSLQNLQIPAVERDEAEESFPATGLSRWEKDCLAYCGSWLSANELGLLAGLPQKEVIGLKLREEVEFGLNVEPIEEEKNRIPLGHLVQGGAEKPHIPVYLNKQDLDKHTFISGVTGSGKTTTCQNILLDWQRPFLVIEPAKTEYRALKEKCTNLIFFTPGRQDVAPFFLNPFELFPGEAITSRADMLKATFEASFAMEAAIPQIMEAAIYRAYENKGWHIGTNLWKGLGVGDNGGPFSDGVYAFPTLSDFVTAVKEVTEKQGFDERLKNDYLGSINARIEGLLVGAKGQMLNTARSIDFSDLVSRQVVIELEEIRSGAEKSLIMGFILTNLLQAVRHCHTRNPDFRHITLVEEAHRLLSRYVPGDSPNKKQGVEVFADMLAEVRKYGESLIIVDQIPEKMTPEVLKNTNTKIVHKLFAQDDKEAIGNTMALDDDQKAFLSNLPPGRAIMFSQGWTKAIQLQIKEKNPTNQADVDSDVIRKAALSYYREPQNIKRGILRGLERVYWKEGDGKKQKKQNDIVSEYMQLLQSADTWLKIYWEYLQRGSAGEKDNCDDVKKFSTFTSGLRSAYERYGLEMVFAYMYWNTYTEADKEREDTLRDVIRQICADNQAKMSVITNNITSLSI